MEDEGTDNYHSRKIRPYRNKLMFVTSKHPRLHCTSSNMETFECALNTPELFDCKLCEFQTLIKVSLHNHVSVFHGEKEASIDLRRTLECYKCDNCEFQTYSLLVLLNHFKDHSKVKWFKCEQCAHTARTKYWIKQHIAVKHAHGAEAARYRCVHCTFQTKRKDFLKIHFRVNHRRVKWFNCAKCPFKSKYKHLLKIHSKYAPSFCGSEVKTDRPEINSVQYILQNSISYNQKLLIKQKGRPTPDLQIKFPTMSKSRIYYRMFNRNIYDKYEWICGCPVLNKLFCFACLLFKRISVWSQHGVNDLKHLAEKARKHQSSFDHLNALMDFGVLGKIDIGSQLDSTYLRNKVKHNEKVEKHRHILRRLIMCIRFCGAFELAFQRDHGQSSSSDPGVYMGLINFAAELDAALAVHLKEAEVFESTSKTIQNELLDAMLAVYRTEVVEQIKSANFIALEVGETTDASNHQQIVLIFRYVISGQISERFWTFIRPAGHTAEELAKAVLFGLEQVLPPSDNFKLISQSYDGFSVVSGAAVQSIIRKSFPYAYFVHCNSHQFNSIIEQAARHKTVKIFFANLQAFSSFFYGSFEHISVLEEVVKRRAARGVPGCWNFKSRIVNTLFEHKDSVIECLDRIIDTPGVGATTISEAYSLLNHLKSPEFFYWLKIFHFIMPHVEVLFNQAQEHGIESLQLRKGMEQFKQHILRVRSFIDHMKETPRDSKRVAKEVCDNILKQIKERFDFKDHLSAAKLFDSKNFKTYRGAFPKNYFDAAVKSYPVLNGHHLKSELTVIYQRDDMCTLDGILSLLVFLEDNNLKAVFSETYKLLDIICTTPMPTSECERCFSTLKKIKTFLSSTVSEGRLNALAVLSIEKNFIQAIPDFDNKVIEIFCSAKNRKMDFTYQ